MIDIKKLQDSFNKLDAEVKESQNFSADGTALTEEQIKANDDKLAEMNRINAEIEEGRKTAEVAFSAGNVDKTNSAKAIMSIVDADPKKQLGKELSAFMKGESLDFAMISSTNGGALLPTDTVVYVVPKPISGFRKAQDYYGISTPNLGSVTAHNISVIDFGAGFAIDENSAGIDVTPSPSTVTVLPQLITSGQVWPGYSLTRFNPNFDATTQIVPGLIRSVELAEEAALVAKIKTDIATLTTNGRVYTPATNTGLTPAEFLNWKYKLAYQYWQDGVFMVSQSLLRLLDGMADANGRPLMVQNVGDSVRTIDGMPVVVSSALESVGASKVAGVFMSFGGTALGYGGPAELKRYVNDPFHVNADGFEYVQYFGAAYLPNAIAVLKFPA